MLIALAIAATAAGQQTQPAAPALTPEQAAELDRARTIITDVKASPEVRRIGAEDLLRLTYPAARDLAVEILGGNGDPLPRIAVCEAIAAVGGRRPELLSAELVGPLMGLLGSADAAVRAKAATALSVFRDGGVAEHLGRLAADPQAPLAKRLAAVEALAFNLDQRQVVAALVDLLATDNDRLRAAVIDALRPAARDDYGADLAAWRQWWAGRSSLDEAGWLRDRVGLLRDRDRAAREAFEQSRAETERRCAVLSTRLIEQLRNVHRLTPEPQREELLIGWLSDPLLEFRQAAVGAVAARISDGHRPGDAVRAALRERFADPAPNLRRAVFDVVAALTDPADADAVLARLKEERDPAVREVVLRTLGRLGNPAAIPVLVGELNDPSASEGCWVEAANSLGMLAMREKVPAEVAAPVIEPLKQRFAAAPPQSVRLRAALLGAMASIGSPQFAPEFTANIEAAEPELLLTALQGVRTLGDATRIDRILALLGSDDARVRRAAAEAVGALGSEPAHLEALVNRLASGTEPNPRVRQAAWAGFQAILARKPAQPRLQWAERLADFPDLEEAYLTALVRDLGASQPPAPEINIARWRLARLYDASGRFAESFPMLRDLWQNLPPDGNPSRQEVGLALLRAGLELRRYERVGEILSPLTEGAEAARKAEIGRMLLEHAQARAAAGEANDLAPLFEAIGKLPPETLDAGLRQKLEEARSAPPPQPEAPQPGTEPAAQ